MTADEQAVLAHALTSDVERAQLIGSSGKLVGIEEHAIVHFAEVLVKKRFATVFHVLGRRRSKCPAMIAAEFTEYARRNRIPISRDRYADAKAFTRWRKARMFREKRTALVAWLRMRVKR